MIAAKLSKHLIIFFFQAEDGIRDYKVTGVQTCALPIWQHSCTKNTSARRAGKARSGPSRGVSSKTGPRRHAPRPREISLHDRLLDGHGPDHPGSEVGRVDRAAVPVKTKRREHAGEGMARHAT